MNIVIEYDSSAANAPAGFKEAVQAAVQFYDYLITNPITVPIVFSYGEIQGQALSSRAAAESSTNGNIENFNSVVSLLTAAATSATDATSIANLPKTDPTSGGEFWVSDAQAQVFGLGSEPGYTDPEDGFVAISSKLSFTWDPNNRAVAGEYDAIGAIEHEISEVLGRYDYLGGSITFNGNNLYSPLDLFRFTAAGARTVAYGPGYFSVDGGKTLQLPFNDPNNGGDGGDWDSGVVGDSYGSAYSGVEGYVSPTDLQVMDVLGYQVASLANPVAGAAPTLSAVNGAQAAITAASLIGLITNDYTGAMVVQSVSLNAGSTGDGTLTYNSSTQTVVFTPAAGFAGLATGTVTLNDNYGGTVNQPVNFNVVVQASPPVIVLPNTTSTWVSGNVTGITTYSGTGVYLSGELITVYPSSTVKTYYDSTSTAYASTVLTTYAGGVTELQNYDGSWHQLSASITTPISNGGAIVQNFDGSWTMTSASITNDYGANTVVQNFNANWVQVSATITQVYGNVVETQNFGATWSQLSSNLTTTNADGTVESQNFDANWNQTSATITAHPNAGETVIQYFNANWVQTSATIIWVGNGQTTTQNDDANWNTLSATVDTVLTSGAVTDRLISYGPTWNVLSEVDTATNGGKSYFVFGQTGGNQTFTAASGNSSTFIFAPGTVAGDTINGLHTLNLGGSIHDVIDFQGYGSGAHLVQVDATHWQIVATGDTTETFTVTGGATLAAGDYAFVAAGTQLTLSSSTAADTSVSGAVTVTTDSTLNTSNGVVATSGASVGDATSGSNAPTNGASLGDTITPASVSLFNQFSASGFSTPSDAGAGPLITSSNTQPGPVIAAPHQTA